MKKVMLHRTSRFLNGHPWIFSNEIAGSPKSFDPGSIVEICDPQGKFLGIGYINPASLIAVRVLSRENEAIDEAFFRRRIQSALSRRAAFTQEVDSFRAIFSESDYLPGLIVDKYADCLSVQILTLGMEHLRPILLPILDEIFQPKTMVLRCDSSSRGLEGLPQEKTVWKGSLDTMPVIHEGTIAFEIDPLGGQKTGFFLDQRENRLHLAELAVGEAALDLFCYAGAWGMQLAAKGLKTTFVDDSELAVGQVQQNAERNRLDGLCSTVRDDVFHFLRREISAGNRYGTVVLDPPAFVKSKTKIKEALRGYRDLNVMAMKLVQEGGILATSSCSHHIDREAFLDMLRSAARDARRTPRILEYRSQGKDHPVLLAAPETEYLKCVFLQF